MTKWRDAGYLKVDSLATILDLLNGEPAQAGEPLASL